MMRFKHFLMTRYNEQQKEYAHGEETSRRINKGDFERNQSHTRFKNHDIQNRRKCSSPG